MNAITLNPHIIAVVAIVAVVVVVVVVVIVIMTISTNITAAIVTVVFVVSQSQVGPDSSLLVLFHSQRSPPMYAS